MGLTLQQIHDCRRGYHRSIVVGELTEDIRSRLGLRIPLVHLSTEQLAHINEKHPDISDYELPLIPHVIETGAIMLEKKKQSVVLAHSTDKQTLRDYVAVMKVVNGCELWLSSFYRVHKRQIRKFPTRNIIVRGALNTK